MVLMSEPTLPLTGAQFEIAAGDFTATVTELGAGLRALSLRGKPLIRNYAPDELPPAGAGQLLAPWPNRIDHGRYAYGGSSYQLDISEPARDNAIHGITRWASWRVVAQAPEHVELGLDLLGRPGYPFCLELRVSYRLSPDEGLEVTLTARNAGSRAAPFGAGAHPYFTAGPGLVDGCELQLPAGCWQPTNDRGIPVGEPVDVAGSSTTSAQAGRSTGRSSTTRSPLSPSTPTAARGRAYPGRTLRSRSGSVLATGGCRSSPAIRSARALGAAPSRSSR